MKDLLLDNLGSLKNVGSVRACGSFCFDGFYGHCEDALKAVCNDGQDIIARPQNVALVLSIVLISVHMKQAEK